MDFMSLLESEAHKDREAIERLKRRYPGWDFVEVAERAAPPVLPFRPRQSRTAAETLVTMAMGSSPQAEWTSRSLFSHIRENGDGLPANDDAAMNAINMAMNVLVEDGTVVRVYEGRGRDPHRYVLNEFSQQTRTADQ